MGYLTTAKTKPSLLLKGNNPRLVDEWQEAPVLWDAVRTAVDDRQEEGLFILTGSTSVDDKQIHLTGTGRISRLKMYTMSLLGELENYYTWLKRQKNSLHTMKLRDRFHFL